jgi:predicted HTH domain antitoxin
VVLPESLARELGAASQDFVAELLERGLREVRIERALERYARGGMSFSAAAHEAGVSQSELARQAYARGMEPPYSVESLAEDLG